MPTNKLVLRTVEEFNAGYEPVYAPIYGLFTGGKSQQYEREVGIRDFRRVTAVGDIRAKHITPKDTEIKQVAIMEGTKTYKKYFMGNQFTISEFQDRQGVEDVVKQVLDEHQLQQDEMLLLGEGTTPGTQINNGLYLSSDPNYSLLDSVAIASGDTRLYDFHAKVIATATRANQVAGRKIIFFYGESILPLFNSLYTTAVRAWKAALGEILGPTYSLVELPAALTPDSANGWMIVNMDQVKLHYTVLPQLMKQGINEEHMYAWFNFLLGSMMLEVTALDGVIRQPATLA